MSINTSSWLKFVKRRILSLSIFILAVFVFLEFPPFLGEWVNERVDCERYYAWARGPVNAWEGGRSNVNPGGEQILCLAQFWGHIALITSIFGLGGYLWKKGM